jgi:TPR repeat protein
MLTGAAPINGSGVLDIIHGHINRPPLAFADIEGGPMVPKSIQKVIMKALSKEPEDRQQTMFEFRLELLAAFSAASGGGTQSTYAPVAEINESGRDPTTQYELALRLESGDGVPIDLEQSRKWMRSAAEAGHREAQYRLAKQYMFGEDDIERDVKTATEWLIPSAKQGFEPAQIMLAGCYEHGYGVDPDLSKAILWYQESARQGNKKAEERLAFCYQQTEKSDSKSMDAWYRGRAAEGDPAAMFEYAVYLKGQPDARKKAVEIVQLLLEAAGKGHISSRAWLSRDVILGKSKGERNIEQTFSWMSDGAQKGAGDAMAVLASCYIKGFGTRPDVGEAMRWLERGAELRDPDAVVLLASCLLLGEGVQRNLARGITLLKSVVESNALAQWKMALCYKAGIGTARDLKESERWFERAAAGGFAQSLPWPFKTPSLSFEEAVATFKTMASVDHRLGCYWLGLCYHNGTGIGEDAAKAGEYYQKSAARGYAPATDALARLRELPVA